MRAPSGESANDCRPLAGRNAYPLGGEILNRTGGGTDVVVKGRAAPRYAMTNPITVNAAKAYHPLPASPRAADFLYSLLDGGAVLNRRNYDRFRLAILHGSDEAVPPAWECLDVTRPLRRVSQHRPKPVHRRVQTMIKIDERAVIPKLLLQLFSADNLAGLSEESRQNL